MKLQEFSKEVELHRFSIGLGKYEFAALIGIKYHTYKSFIEQTRKTWDKNLMKIVAYMKSVGKEYDSLELNEIFK